MMDGENVALEPTLDVEVAPTLDLAPTLQAQAPASATPPSHYWHAQRLAETLQREFSAAQHVGNSAAMRDHFYLLANYYTRTAAILRSALNKRREALAQAALHNLIALHTALHVMYSVAPGTVPSTLTLNREARPRLIESLIMRILQDASRPLELSSITRQFNALDVLANAHEKVIQRHVSNLLATGHVHQHNNMYTCTTRPYQPVNLDQAALHTLAGAELFAHLNNGGFHSLADVMAHKEAFRSLFSALTGFADGTAALFLAAAEVLFGPRSELRELHPWRHADLIHVPHLRPYQYEAYSIFRSYNYQGQVIEAPTGSGKTMIGMLCIQDWLRSLAQGQSILVLVPTVNYQQQWVGELCYKPLGLRLSPHLVFTGTPSHLESMRRRSGISPCVIVMTYTSLAQTGSGRGKGGFDQDSIEIFLQGNNVQYIIFDEVHKVVEDIHSVSADVTRILTEWVQDGSLKGAIGFSGTAVNYRSRFAKLGMQLVYILPAAELIAYGFVAPFAEFGVPFAYSDREQRIRDLLDTYKARLHDFITLIGSAHLRRWFASIPLEERMMLGRSILRMNTGQQDEILAKRFAQWEQGKGNMLEAAAQNSATTSRELDFTELPLLTLIQLSLGWSDEDLVRASREAPPNFSDLMRTSDTTDTVSTPQSVTRAMQRFEELLLEFKAIRNELKPLIYLPETVNRLSAEGFGRIFDAGAMLRLPDEVRSATARAERMKDGLASTIVGLYMSLSDWYLRVGEGRVDSIKAIIEAERASRAVHGVIIFDTGNRLRWQAGVATPGYAGVAGVFSQMLGDRRFTPMAVLSSEMYLAYDEIDPLPQRIAAFIKREIMLGEVGEALFGLVTQGLDIRGEQLSALRSSLTELLTAYINTLHDVQAPRQGEFYRHVFVPLRKVVRQVIAGDTRRKLLARLSLKHYHVRTSLDTFFDYAIIVDTFIHAHIAELVQVNGTHHTFFVVPMAQGERKQLMYDLSARIVDAEDLPVNMIIVSSWARTGWNVIKPNVLIDATATRDVTAWQQLRGRAMRAMRTWTNTCYRLVLSLMSFYPDHRHEAREMFTSVDSYEAFEDGKVQPQASGALDDDAKTLLCEVHREAQKIGADDLVTKIERGILVEFTFEERVQLITELMLARNKVTHVYELVKAYGSGSQVRFDRPTRQWRRSESISIKHAHEYAVSPISGTFTAGPEHAPLIYADDPRKDVPSELQDHIIATLRDSDSRIVKGWLTTIASGIQETADES